MKQRTINVLMPIVVALVVAMRTTFAQTSSPEFSFHVSGVILREGSDVPVPRCHLVIRPEGRGTSRRRDVQDAMQRAVERTAETDTQGRFSFDLPSAGRWQLSASAVGFRTQLYNEHEGFSSAVVVGNGLAPPRLIFLLEPDSTVSGFVRDEAGEAVRNAVLLLQQVNVGMTTGTHRQRATTDDRGHYEISEVPPGSYKVSARATPWYTAGVNRAGDGGVQTARADSSFDVVYPSTWYPGVLDSDMAGEIKVHGGEAVQVDFNLRPIPAAHLRVAGPSPTSNGSVAVPMIERVEANTPTGPATSVVTIGGQMEFGGLSPGLYRISTSQPDGHATTAFLHVAAGADIVLSGMDTAGTADVTCQFADDEKAPYPQVVLTDVSSGAMFTSSARTAFGLRRRQPVSDSRDGVDAERHIAAPAGRYQVTLNGDPDLYLTSLSLREKPVASRFVVLSGGPVTLTVHVARGRASLTGLALVDGSPSAGAMIMLVPATFGQIGTVDLLRRDQSNTDGSYELDGIVPGDYILLAIDRGWGVNWHDPATLDRYLLHGIPLSLQPHSKAEQNVLAQAP